MPDYTQERDFEERISEGIADGGFAELRGP